MENLNIHKSLLELEGSLKDLQSAKNQVNSFSVKSEQMLEIYTKILQHLEFLQSKFEKENANLFNQLSQKYEKASNAISSRSDTLEEKSKKYIDMLSNSYIKVQDKIASLEYSINDAKEKVNNTDLSKNLKEFESKMDAMNKSILTFKKELEEFRKSVNYNLQTELKKNNDSYSNLFTAVKIALDNSNKIFHDTRDYLEKKGNDIQNLEKKIEGKINVLINAIAIQNTNFEKLMANYETLKKQNKGIMYISIVTLIMFLVIAIMVAVKFLLPKLGM